MIETLNRNKVENTSVRKYGGYLIYWKLYFQLWQLSAVKVFTPWQRFQTIVIILIKTPWWLAIKPLGCLFSTKTRLRGSYERMDGVLAYAKEETTVVWRFIGIPFFMYWYSRTSGKKMVTR